MTLEGEDQALSLIYAQCLVLCPVQSCALTNVDDRILDYKVTLELKGLSRSSNPILWLPSYCTNTQPLLKHIKGKDCLYAKSVSLTMTILLQNYSLNWVKLSVGLGWNGFWVWHIVIPVPQRFLCLALHSFHMSGISCICLRRIHAKTAMTYIPKLASHNFQKLSLCKSYLKNRIVEGRRIWVTASCLLPLGAFPGKYWIESSSCPFRLVAIWKLNPCYPDHLTAFFDRKGKMKKKNSRHSIIWPVSYTHLRAHET